MKTLRLVLTAGVSTMMAVVVMVSRGVHKNIYQIWSTRGLSSDEQLA